MSAEASLHSSKAPICAWYGDDFTGTLAVLEILAFAGLSGVVFLRRPDADTLEKFGDLAAIGLAGTARAESPAWMDDHLPEVFDWLSGTGAELIAYKVCSTLDSAPQIGSIGRAAEIGMVSFGQSAVACLIACPSMGRYQVFGNLFATGPDGRIYRLDRHPVMTRHPITPMSEADVAQHLSRQTALPTQNIGRSDPLWGDLDCAKGIVCLDAYDDSDMEAAGTEIWDARHSHRFVIGSQGIQIALVSYFRSCGLLGKPPSVRKPGARQTVVISGSVSPTTAVQIEYALENGFKGIKLDPIRLVDGHDSLEEAAEYASDAAQKALAGGRLPLIYTALGPDDLTVAKFRDFIQMSGLSGSLVQEKLGTSLGYILKRVLDKTGVRRTIIAGGDTSGRIMLELDGFAVTPLCPGNTLGTSLFRLAATNELDGLEVALKGGQMGSRDVFERLAMRPGEE
ncbi:four-carbon acid sugar kinase family protein [Thioclava sp. 15-R06ZXC-3]|uniref:Four-carbon acid sugar kinase family protein n=1 Tax=Thioclava arctica TaxID=3238301 RepID=A0ABV3TQD3_9RHOB